MSATLSKIDGEQLHLRKVQNVISSPATLAHSNLSLQPIGHSKISTISEAQIVEPLNYIPLRPELTPGKVNLEDGEVMAIQKFLNQAAVVAKSDEEPRIKEAYLKIVLKLHNLAEEIAADHIGYISKQIRKDASELEQLSLKRTEEIHKHALEMSKESTWSFFSNICQYFLSATTLVLGGTLIATGVGATAGAFLMAAGGLGLLDRVAKDTGAYLAVAGYFTKSREMQEKIASWITTTVLFATIGLGVAGGVMSSISSGIEAAQVSMNAVGAAKKLEIAIGLSTAGFSVVKSNSEKKLAETQKTLKLMEGRIALLQQGKQRWGSEAKNTIHMMQTISTEAKQTIAKFR